MQVRSKLRLILDILKLTSVVDKLDQLKNYSEQSIAEEAFKQGILNRHQLGRLKMLWEFSKLAPRAKEIELEWQKIQQDEHDEFFAFQIFRGRNEVELAYKKGIVKGIQWCVERFSSS